MKMLTKPRHACDDSFLSYCREDVYQHDSESVGIPAQVLSEVQDSSLMNDTLERITDSVYMLELREFVR